MVGFLLVNIVSFCTFLTLAGTLAYASNRWPTFNLLVEYVRRWVMRGGRDPLLAPIDAAEEDNPIHVRRVYVAELGLAAQYELHWSRVSALLTDGRLYTPYELAARCGYVPFTKGSCHGWATLVFCYTDDDDEHMMTYNLASTAKVVFPPYAPAAGSFTDADSIVRAEYTDWRDRVVDCTDCIRSVAGPRQNFYADVSEGEWRKWGDEFIVLNQVPRCIVVQSIKRGEFVLLPPARFDGSYP